MKKKLIPVAIAIVLILIVLGVSVVPTIIEKYSYSDEKYDMTTYFENSSEHDAAIIMQSTFMGERAYVFDGTYYVDMDFVRTYFNKRFYEDEVEGLLLYALPLDVISTQIGQDSYEDESGVHSLGYVATRQEGDKLLVALDYVKKFTNFSYEAFDDPHRIFLHTEWDAVKTATVVKDSAVRHRGGIKSPILKEVPEGETLYVIEQMEEWSKVETEDAIIGFIENKHLSDTIDSLPIPVNDYVEPEYTNLCRNHKINMGWHAVAGVGGNDTLESVVRGTKGMNVISPTWFSLSDSIGSITSFGTTEYVNKAHNMGLEVWPTLNNTESNAEVDLKQLLSSTSNRKNLIANVLSTALELGIDGINVDIEMLPVSAGKDFSEFIRELSIACRKNNLVLSIDNYVPIGNTDYYDRKTQGEVADYVVIMGYDEHYAGSQEAGSVASIGYVETGIKNTLEEVPAEKIINGVPFYTRLWETSGVDVSSTAMGMENANEWIAGHGMTMQWDDATCQNYGEITSGDKRYQMWLEDAESIKVKCSVMDAYNIAGIAEWRLGYETPDIWDVIEEYVNR
ncbi:MAG: glycosyl hydrolase family 18 protein [Lachnospiraceae bacterium]|nr:glycosyl hydrolase family 18 protein [Lachnospiraceae bacterium]